MKHAERIIASITQEKHLDIALKSKVGRINLVAGSINTLHSVMERVRQAGKRIYLHVEMIQGIGRDAASIQYLASTFKPDGIITTKSTIVSHARQIGLPTIQRVFAVDSTAVDTAIRMIKTSKPDEIELMPGLMPRVIEEVKAQLNLPLIAGGLIRHRREIEIALESGADYVSMGNTKLW